MIEKEFVLKTQKVLCSKRVFQDLIQISYCFINGANDMTDLDKGSHPVMGVMMMTMSSMSNAYTVQY